MWGDFGAKFLTTELKTTDQSLAVLEHSLSVVAPAVCFTNAQSALELIFESLGCREALIPVLLPVTAPSYVFAAVLRSGGLPFLLDVDQDGQYRLPLLLEALEDVDRGCIVLHTRPLGMPVRPELLAACEKTPTIIINDTLPSSTPNAESFLGDFNVYSLVEMIGAGSAVFIPYVETAREFRSFRDDLCGPHTALPELLARLAVYRLSLLPEREKVVQEFGDMCRDVLKKTLCTVPCVTVAVRDNRRFLEDWKFLYNPIKPLHTLEAVAARFPEGTPEYPGAETISTRFLSFPTFPNMIEPSSIEKLSIALRSAYVD